MHFTAPSRWCCPLLLTVFLLLPSLGRAKGYEVIVNAKVDVSQISENEVKLIYLGDKPFWDQSKRVYVARPEDTSSAWQEFVGGVLKLTPTDFLNRWRYRLFSGRGIPPKRFENADSLIRFVSETDGAIGILDPKVLAQLGDRKQSIKVVTLTP